MFHISYNKKFLKDLAAIPCKYRAKIEGLGFSEISKYSTLSNIKNLKKLKGYDLFYRIRVDDYRIGLKADERTLVFERVLHRKDIYNLFP